MQIRLGAVYQDGNAVQFIATIDRISTNAQDVRVRLVNLTNWISLGTIPGRQLASSKIDCPDLTGIVLVAPTLADYYQHTNPNSVSGSTSCSAPS